MPATEGPLLQESSWFSKVICQVSIFKVFFDDKTVEMENRLEVARKQGGSQGHREISVTIGQLCPDRNLHV